MNTEPSLLPRNGVVAVYDYQRADRRRSRRYSRRRDFLAEFRSFVVVLAAIHVHRNTLSASGICRAHRGITPGTGRLLVVDPHPVLRVLERFPLLGGHASGRSRGSTSGRRQVPVTFARVHVSTTTSKAGGACRARTAVDALSLTIAAIRATRESSRRSRVVVLLHLRSAGRGRGNPWAGVRERLNSGGTVVGEIDGAVVLRARRVELG